MDKYLKALKFKITLKLFICQGTVQISIRLKIFVANNKSDKIYRLYYI